MEELFQSATKGRGITEFDEDLWSTLVDYVTVHTDGRISVTFRNGTEIGEKTA